MVHVLYPSTAGDVENANAANSLKQSSSMIAPAMRYAVNMLKIPRKIEYSNITHLISIAVVWQMPDRKKGTVLTSENAYMPRKESG